ncbi:hypothetical protein J5X84_36025 [Streptosporangiaceae bacterium NEAU-GS5]|nr:hypothetical protein [Streptosporangiaceae bacterium NEAU-GS5]
MKLARTRTEALERNGNSSKRHLEQAAAAQERGDANEMERHLAVAADLDRVAEGIARGDYDDVIGD